jgi:hypothetical protein
VWISDLRFIEADWLQEVINSRKREKGVQQETDLEAEDIDGLCLVMKDTTETFPQDAYDQLSSTELED